MGGGGMELPVVLARMLLVFVERHFFQKGGTRAAHPFLCSPWVFISNAIWTVAWCTCL